MVRRALTAAFVLLVCACGNPPEPASPSLTDPAKASVEPTTATSAAPAASNDVGSGGGEGDAPKHRRRPFPIHNSCPDVVTVVFGEDPKAAGADKRTVNTNSSVDGPRDAEGKQTVSLLDDKGEPIAKVHMNRGMKQLEIGRSCRTLDAH